MKALRDFPHQGVSQIRGTKVPPKAPSFLTDDLLITLKGNQRDIHIREGSSKETVGFLDSLEGFKFLTPPVANLDV